MEKSSIAFHSVEIKQIFLHHIVKFGACAVEDRVEVRFTHSFGMLPTEPTPSPHTIVTHSSYQCEMFQQCSVS